MGVTTTIVLADDHNIMRKGLSSLIEKQPQMKVVGEAEDGRTTIHLAQNLKPDIVIMDISMPDLNGIEATSQIVDTCPGTKVIGLSIHADRRFVSQMLKAGAMGYLLKDCAFEELKLAIHAVTHGNMYLSPSVAGGIVKDYVKRLSKDDTSAFTVLSEREREVLQLLAEGKSMKQIASDLYLSVKTIETHRQNIMKKLNIYNIPELVKYAIREGLTFLDS